MLRGKTELKKNRLCVKLYFTWSNWNLLVLKYSVYSRNVTAAILVSQNNETATMLVALGAERMFYESNESMSHESRVTSHESMSQWVRSERIKVSVETIKLSITFT